MGKRKSTRHAQHKHGVEKLDTQFTCPFCNYDPKSVTCFLDHKNLLGTARCRICSEAFTTKIHILSAAIDVYSDWIDACERVNDGPQAAEEPHGPVKKRSSPKSVRRSNPGGRSMDYETPSHHV